MGSLAEVGLRGSARIEIGSDKELKEVGRVEEYD